MNAVRIAVFIFFCVVLGPAFAVGGVQDLQPIADRNRPIEIPGVSVLPPQGEDWFVFPVFTGQFAAFPDLVAISTTRGLYCSHPYWPQYHIDLTYQQLYAKGQTPLARDPESDVFFKNIVFTSGRPVAEPSPRALWVSHTQAGVQAHE